MRKIKIKENIKNGSGEEKRIQKKRNRKVLILQLRAARKGKEAKDVQYRHKKKK